jgi:hypothetical protein
VLLQKPEEVREHVLGDGRAHERVLVPVPRQDLQLVPSWDDLLQLAVAHDVGVVNTLFWSPVTNMKGVSISAACWK